MSSQSDNVKTLAAAQQRYLSFSLGQEEYAVPLLSVKEVIAVPEITPIPFTPPHYLGITNLRGQVISVIDLRKKLGIQAAASPEMSVIICDLSPLVLGVMVDSINAVVAPAPHEIATKPDIQTTRNSDYITGVYQKGQSLILLLELVKALDVSDLQLTAQHRQSKISA